MALLTFTPPVGPSPGTAHKPTVNLFETEFGDGYSQPTPKGLNHVRKSVTPSRLVSAASGRCKGKLDRKGQEPGVTNVTGFQRASRSLSWKRLAGCDFACAGQTDSAPNGNAIERTRACYAG